MPLKKYTNSSLSGRSERRYFIGGLTPKSLWVTMKPPCCGVARKAR